MDNVADMLPRLNIEGDCRKYSWWCPQYFEYDWMKGAPRERFTSWQVEDGFHKATSWTWSLKKLEEREDMQRLNLLLAQSRDPLARQRWWTNGEKLLRTYLMARACDIAKYGQKVADQTLPQPTVQGNLPAQVADMAVFILQALMVGACDNTYSNYADMVAFMTQLLEEDERRKVNQIQQSWFAEHEKRAQKEFDQKFRNQLVLLPACLDPRVLTDNEERKKLIKACRKELLQSVPAALTAIEDFVQFCTLLSKPENLIKKPSWQYVEKQVSTRTVKDMQDEMAQELTDLPPKIAYAKFIQEKGEERVVIKHKFKTLQPPRVLITDFSSRAVRDCIEQKTLDAGMVKERVKIGEEIRLRQEKWRSQITGSKRQIPAPEEPPPTSY